jgi:hypothetical protein
MGWSMLAPLLVAAAATSAPQTGHYDARLCVSVSAQPANCGAAQAQMMADGELRIRVDDIVYHLVFGESQLIGVTMHGNMQVAEFASPYRWMGNLLQFSDAPRGLRYEVQLGTK